LKTFDKLCKAMDTITGVITVAIMVFITIIVVASVVTRLAGTPIQWQYEATLVCMSWTTFLGMAITFKLDEHMRLTFISNAMPPHFRNIWLAIMDVLVLAFLIYGAYLSIGVIETAMPTKYQTIPVSRGIFYLPFPIGCVFSACQLINVNYKRLTGQLESTDGAPNV